MNAVVFNGQRTSLQIGSLVDSMLNLIEWRTVRLMHPKESKVPK